MRAGSYLVPNPVLCLSPQGDYTRGHDEQLPYSDSSMRSMYHIRDFEVYRMMQVGAECRLGLPSPPVVTPGQGEGCFRAGGSRMHAGSPVGAGRELGTFVQLAAPCLAGLRGCNEGLLGTA